MALSRQSVTAFVTALASRRPAPGGGSAAALAAGLGAALYVKVGRIVIARRPSPSTRRRTERRYGPLASQRRRLQHLCAVCARGHRALLRLVDEDARAYGQLMAAWRRRPGTVPVRGQSPAFRRAQRRALEAPLAICRQTLVVLQQGRGLGPAAGPALASDVAAGSALLVGAFVAAASTAAVNLEGMGQSAQAAAIRKQIARVFTHD